MLEAKTKKLLKNDKLVRTTLTYDGTDMRLSQLWADCGCDISRFAPTLARLVAEHPDISLTVGAAKPGPSTPASLQQVQFGINIRLKRYHAKPQDCSNAVERRLNGEPIPLDERCNNTAAYSRKSAGQNTRLILSNWIIGDQRVDLVLHPKDDTAHIKRITQA